MANGLSMGFEMMTVTSIILCQHLNMNVLTPVPSFLQVIVMSGEAEGSLSSLQKLALCERGFTREEYIIQMEQGLERGQALCNGQYTQAHRFKALGAQTTPNPLLLLAGGELFKSALIFGP